MQNPDEPDPKRIGTTYEELAGIANSPIEEALTIVHGALDSAARASDPQRAVAIDLGALLVLRDAQALDAILQRLDIDALASLSDRWIARLESEGESPSAQTRRGAWEVLDIARRVPVRRRIAAAGTVGPWADRILRLIELSHLTFGTILQRHAALYGSKTLLQIPTQTAVRSMSWRQFAGRVDSLARGLISIAGEGEPPRIAILSENRIEMAIADLACLCAGLVDVVIPANATETDVNYMLGHSRCRFAIVSDREQLQKVLHTRESLPNLERIFVMDPAAARPREAAPLDEIAGRSGQTSPSTLEARQMALRAGDLATVMYTSGTTGMPKGIQFSHRNIVFKRFARALALPEIGEDDVFLCYLPLFHTFGRYFELYGCIFWGATYCFQDNPSPEALVQGMRRFRPTVFISVPKKWMQIYEAIGREVDVYTGPDAQIGEAVRRVTGGRLRWGLSAAGRLDSDIFRFFQRYGIELLSGFGMTEGTGGITMTPPGRYKDDSLGPALPGIELKLASDGELLVRGPYVTIGYLDPPDKEPSFDADGWLRTGDLMVQDEDGYIRLIDRKKEIYKNIKGETIAPQRIEGLFRDFESVGRVFLVGDHREFNTALIWPNPQAKRVDFASLSPDELQAHFTSIVHSVNGFLAPYERIVDFAVIGRDLDPEREELTPKGTPRRRVVEQNFAEEIRLLYRRTTLRVGGASLIFPNWLFQALGLTAQDVRIVEDRIALPAGGDLRVRRIGNGRTQVGAFIYRHPPNEPLQLGVLLTTPRLWLGNDELVGFSPLEVRLRLRLGRAGDPIEVVERVAAASLAKRHLEGLKSALARDARDAHDAHDLLDLHLAALAFDSRDETAALESVRLLQLVLEGEEGPLSEPARLLLARAASSPSLAVRRAAFLAIVPTERDFRFRATLAQFLKTPGVLLDVSTRAALCERDLSPERLDTFIDAAWRECSCAIIERGSERRAASLLKLLSSYGAAHPTRYRRVRCFLVRAMLFGGREGVREEAAGAVADLEAGFRRWLGPTTRIAVDMETGREYRWDDVVAFDDSVSEEDRRRLLAAIRATPIIREAVFLFSGGAAPRLGDIPAGGISVRALGERHGKAIHRVTVTTRFQGSFDLTVSLNRSIPREKVLEEIHWLVLCGESAGRPPVVQDFGGYWPDHDLWTEEYVAGETLDRALRRLSRPAGDEERARSMWPFLAWTAIAAYVDLWNRTGRRLEMVELAPDNVIVPTHDYHTGARILSISALRPHAGLAETARTIRQGFLDPVESQHPKLLGVGRPQITLAAILEVVGEEEGLRMLRDLLALQGEQLSERLLADLPVFIAEVEERGFVPMRLYFAIQRYRRWTQLSPDATPQAKVRALQEFYDTYALQDLTAHYPETRTRFFRETVFAGAAPALASGLDEIVTRLRRREVDGDALIDAIADLRARLEVGPDEDYFLARLSYPHLRPEDAAGFVQVDLGGRHQSEMVVTIEDNDGNPFLIRHALNPKEVGRLHRLFLEARLDVRFRPEHHYLVALNDRGQIIGGIYYEPDEIDRTGHLEKIVVAEPYRRKGVADGLMKEFFSRLWDGGITMVTTGFFRPEYFYAYGFTIEKRHAGLVKSLLPPDARSA